MMVDLAACPNCGQELPPLYGDHPNGPCGATAYRGQRAMFQVDVTWVLDGAEVRRRLLVVPSRLAMELTLLIEEAPVQTIAVTAVTT